MADTPTWPRVTVVGSANVDLTFMCDRIPHPGETLLARGERRSPGGKGANQAVACARATDATAVAFVGAVGADSDGDFILARLAADRVDTFGVVRTEQPTGKAIIAVDAAGENSIIVSSGANATQAEFSDDQRAVIGIADLVLCQLEIPIVGVLAAARARQRGALFALNAAPSAALPDELWAEIDLLIVNEHEAADLAGGQGLELDLESLAARAGEVVITLGARGAIAMAGAGTRPVEVSAPTLSAVDTVGAGDTFAGVYAVYRAAGIGVQRSLDAACAAGALAVTKPGAQDAIPTRDEVLALLESQPNP